MKPAAFSYHRPASLEDALALLARFGGDAKPLAGGQSLVPMMNMRLASPPHLVDLNDLSELAQVRVRGDRLEVGALARHRTLAESALVAEHCPLLAQAARTIAHSAIRERGTLGGSLAHADPAAQHTLVAVTLGAQLTLARQGGQRVVDAQDFLLSAMTTALQPDEIVLAVSYPCVTAGEVSAWRMFNQRHGDYALVAVAATLALEQGRVRSLRLGIGGVAPVPQRLDAVAQAFLGRAASADWVAAVARAARDAVTPEDQPGIPALYRKELTETLVARALARCLERSGTVA
ncbi:MAG TPA: xanthine dehydrogenase family protein subunit M [Ramlibacter sp.]|uniref:FAD binding domain-containing protein n=1 Tax=Ramlibacter sp. TaxID=1917967 RepID=UPI002D7EE949|nr:xanthine dehydrogenase family protein subunit M [Ramlibacter sp.]HET8745034.1 xanthine dehydrogenase family protein subunit M [Ramlibacter sp.]